MLVDPTHLASGALIETDICVIGAGPAGITFARECIGQPLRVAVLESGGFQPDRAIRTLSTSDVRSRHYSPDAARDGRERGFGGTSLLWGYETKPDDGRGYARSLPPESVDFESDPDRPASGWPLSFDSMTPYYKRAQQLWNGGPFDYRVARWAEGDAPLRFRDDTITTRMAQHGSHEAFAVDYRQALTAAENVSVYLGCTVLQLEAGDSPRKILRVRVSGPDGRHFTVSAKLFILAGGGVENAQLLLMSEPTRPGGPGNRHDNVGRYLCDHPEFRLGMLRPSRQSQVDEIGLYDMRWVGSTMVSGFLTIDEAVKREQKLLNLSAVLVPQRATFGSAAERALQTFRVITRGERPSSPTEHLIAMAKAPLTTVDLVRHRHRDYEEYRGGWSGSTIDRSIYKTIELHGAAEQTPDRANRITLGNGHDRLGRRPAHIDWSWSKADQANLLRSIRIISSELEGSGFGRFEHWQQFEGSTRMYHFGIHHPMGTTRMDADSKSGVVDTNGQVHGIDNLLVAGSSVFSNGHGYANPTLSVIALTVRLADHVKSIL